MKATYHSKSRMGWMGLGCLCWSLFWVGTVNGQETNRIQKALGEERSLPRLKVHLQATQWRYRLGEAVWLRFSVENDTPSEGIFRCDYEGGYGHFEFMVRDEDGHTSPLNVAYLKWLSLREDNADDEKHTSKKRIELGYQERFVTRIDLSRWIALKRPGRVFVEGVFYPNPKLRQHHLHYPIKPIAVNVVENEALMRVQTERPMDGDFFLKSNQRDHETSRHVTYHTPQEAVKQHLRSHQTGDWEKHFSTLELKDYLSNAYASTELYERFRFSKYHQQYLLLKEFEALLIKQAHHPKIADFKLMEVLIIQDKRAAVHVQVKQKWYRQKEVKRLNPLTGTIEYLWKDSQGNPYEEDSFYLFLLTNIQHEGWKIVQKEVNLLRHSLGGSSSPLSRTLQEDKKALGSRHLPLVENILFERGQATFVKESEKTLEKVEMLMKRYGYLNLILKGHADSEGSQTQNEDLGLERAFAVKNYLVQQGIEARRMTCESYGELQTVYDEKTPETKAKNRRVELYFTPR